MKRFRMDHLFFENNVEFFDEENAPEWLTSSKSIPGSTMDMRWFWNDYILKLEVNQSIKTDFRNITRIE